METKKVTTDAQKRAHQKYMANYVEIKVRMTPERRTAIQAFAASNGESVTAFINRAVDALMQSEQKDAK